MPPRRAAHAAGKVDEEGVAGVHGDPQGLELPHQPFGGHGVAQEKGLGVLVVHKVAFGVQVGKAAAVFHGLAVVGVVFAHRDPMAAEEVLFPPLGVGGHVDNHLKAYRCAHDADAQAQVARGAHLDGVLAEEFPGLGGGQLGVVVAGAGEQAVGQGQVFGVLQNLIDAPPGLHRPGHGQGVVLLQQQVAGYPDAVLLLQPLLEPGHRGQGGFDDPLCGPEFGEAGHQEGGEPGQAGLGLVDVRHGQLTAPAGRFKGDLAGVDPGDLPSCPEVR